MRLLTLLGHSCATVTGAGKQDPRSTNDLGSSLSIYLSDMSFCHTLALFGKSLFCSHNFYDQTIVGILLLLPLAHLFLSIDCTLY